MMSVYCILLLAIFAVGVEARLRRHFEPTPSGFNEDQAPRSRCWSSGNGQPAKWWNEGERVDRGKYWYECHRGQLVSRGCFSDNKERLEIGGKYAAGDYELECFMDQDGYLKFRHSACVDDNGQRHAAGDSWNDKDNLYWYECSKDGPYLRASIKGCLTHDKTKKLKLGERYDFGEYTYECNMKFNGSVSLCSVGCIHNSEHYNVGQQWPDGDFVFYCKLQGGRTRKVCVGCQFRDKRLYDGDRYHKENTVYQCQVRPDHYGHRPVGCVTKDDNGLTVERVLGCRWYRQEEDSKIEQTCQLDDAKKLAVVKTVSCIYRFKGYDTILLFPNTYTIWNAPGTKEAQGLACRTTANGDAQLETFDVSQVAQLTQGLKYEQPRG